MEQLSGRTAVITGGASGIGLATAQLLGAEGMNLVLADIEAGPLTAYTKVCRYLELEPEAPEVRYARTTAQPLDERL